MRKSTSLICLLATLAFLVSAGAGTENEPKLTHFPAANRFEQDFPFQGACITVPGNPKNVAMKGIALKLGHQATMLFDTDLLRMAGGWTGKFITTYGVAFDGRHGGHPAADGDVKFSTGMVAGWEPAGVPFSDPRTIEPFGPVPVTLGRWDGMYLAGDTVTLSYTVLGSKIYEQPSVAGTSENPGFVRTFKIDAIRRPLSLLVCEVPGAEGSADKGVARLTGPDSGTTTAGGAGLPDGARLTAREGRIVLELPATSTPVFFKLVINRSRTGEAAVFDSLLAGDPQWVRFENGGPQHWSQAVHTTGLLATNATPDGAYVLDRLTAPENNPWKRPVRFGGMDFFSDGKRAALCTWDGDIWIVSGIDEKLNNLTWRRFASGMYETLGLKIVGDVIYTSGRDQITRYADLNQDGEADYYENFCNLYSSSEGFHEFVFDLQADRAGQFYLAKAGPVRGGGQGFGGGPFGTVTSKAGTLMKVSPDGRRLEVIATGFRAPNGIGVREEDGQVTTSDNEGTWVPTTPINWIRPGGFYGVENTAHQSPSPPFDRPLCWLAHNGPNNFDNSGGGQVWVSSRKWGPYSGELLHLSYGKCRLFLVMKEELAGGLMQGGVVQIPLKFTSSAMRGRFNPADGQLYVCGLRGWQTDAANPTGFDRVRFTGKPAYSVRELHVNKTGVQLTFTQPLKEDSATDLENFSVKRWNYERAEHYGSPEFQLTDPQQKGRESVTVTKARLSADGKTLTLELKDVRPVMQQSIKYNLKARDGTAINQEIEHTIHAVP